MAVAEWPSCHRWVHLFLACIERNIVYVRILHFRFAKYFENHKERDIRDHMRIALGRDRGFGDHAVTTNPIESLNAKIKRWNSFQKKDFAGFLEDMKMLVDSEKNGIIRAWKNQKGKGISCIKSFILGAMQKSCHSQKRYF